MLTRCYPRFTYVAVAISLLFLGSNSFANDALFHIECPYDVTIDCDDDTDDLSGYGWAYVYGYGDPQPAGPPVVHYYLNSCGTGHITRTWSASDYSGNVYSCTQYIYVGSGGGFNEYNIHWPPHYYTDDCNAEFHPDWLPAPYDYPTYDDIDCSMIMIGYEDEVFNGDGCTKVLRKWKVIDWCTYDPNDHYSDGRWEHTQILKVTPDPYGGGGFVFDCIDDITVSANGDCSGAYVSLDNVTGVGACGSSVTVTNYSPYADYSGPNASGFYPLGTTKVMFRGKDGCGNTETCQIYITVKDLKKPTPVCLHGITANLMVQPGGGFWIDLDPKWFDKGSFDNCTPDHKLLFSVEPSRFTCDELGRQTVKVYVTDQSGNSQYCTTYVNIQDNMGMCPPPDTSALSGLVSNSLGMPLKGVSVALSDGSNTWNTETDENGEYVFENMVEGPEYTITPDVRDNVSDGISTFDLLYIAQYIIGLQDLTQTHQMMAADADMDGNINIIDLALFRKLLLQSIDELPHKHAWRFVDPNQVNGMNMNDWVGYIKLEDFDAGVIDFNFLGVKLGDINNSAAKDGSVRNVDVETIYALDEVVEENTRINVSLRLKEMRFIEGWQASFRFDNVDMTDIEILGSPVIQYGNDSYRFDADRGLLNISYISPLGTEVVDGELVTFSFTTLRSGKVSDFIHLGNTLDAEIYEQQKIHSLDLVFAEEVAEIDAKSADLVVYPNPFDDELTIQVPSELEIRSIRVVDATGRLLSSRRLVEGESNIISIGSDLLPGIYWVEAVSDTDRIVKKVIKK